MWTELCVRVPVWLRSTGFSVIPAALQFKRGGGCHLDAFIYLIQGPVLTGNTTAVLILNKQASNMRNWTSFQFDKK